MDVKAFVRDLFAPLQRRWARKDLDDKMIALAETKKAYEANKVPAGHELYQQLHAAAIGEVESYASKWDTPVAQLKMEIPFLYGLEQKAFPGTRTEERKTATVTAVLFAFLLGIVAVPALWAAAVSVYHHVVRWLA